MLVKLKIWRSTPTFDLDDPASITGAERKLVEYEVEVGSDATLLDALDQVKHFHDGTLAYRKSCRMAICGSCGMRMDGRAVLACKTRMAPLAAKGAVPVIAPMGNMKVVRDLVTDMTDFWNKVRAMTPWLNRVDEYDLPADGRELLVTPEEQVKITKESLCIMCGCCVSECNSMEADPAFLGPAALAKQYRFVGDERDQRTEERLKSVNGQHGVWDCTRCYYCNERCPKGVDPRDAIAKLGAAMFDHGMTSDKGARHAKVFVNSAKGVGPLYNGHLSETALVPFTLGPEFAKPSWQLFGAKLFMRGKAPPPWHTMLHKQGRLDEVQKLWRLLEREEGPGRRGGDLDTPAAPLPPNVPTSLRKTLTPDELFELTGARFDDSKPPGGHDPLDQVDLATYPAYRDFAEGRTTIAPTPIGGFPHGRDHHRMKRVAYYAGCLASLSAKELDSSTRALAPMLDLELLDMPNATCNGAGDIHEAKPDFYLHLNARVLSQAEQLGVDTMMTICNVCTLNLRQANQRMQGDEAVRERVNKNLAAVGVEPYNGTVDVQHFLWLITTGDRYEQLKKVANKGLDGMKIAPFYGCQILRPSKILGFEDPDSPQSLERIIEACGGIPVDYPAKLKCCGFPIVLAREEVALNEVTQPLQQAAEAGAAAIVTPCPLCHLSLDAWQSKAEKQAGVKFDMPTLHMSQLIGVAAGLTESELKFKRHVTPVSKAIRDAVAR